MNRTKIKELIKGHRELAQIDDDLLEYIDFSKLIELNKRNYKDFNGMLEVESNQDTRELMKMLYKQEMHADIEYLDFDNSYREKYLQWHGVDVILTKNNNKYYVQEKITRKRYDSLLFEIEKASGKAGWAVDESELADVLIYYQPHRVFIFRMKQIREYVIKKLSSGDKDLRYLDTDNKNILIPIKELSDNVKMIEYEFIADEKVWECK